MPDRIRLRREKGWRLPASTIKVDRTTIYGNPFKPGEPNHLGWGDVRDTAHAVWLYRSWLTTPTRSIVFESDRHRQVLERLPALAGRNLGCWCLAASPCHADVLLELANRPLVEAWSSVLLTGSHLPLTRDEAMVATGQFARLMGIDPDDVESVGRVVSAVAAVGREGIVTLPRPGGAS